MNSSSPCLVVNVSYADRFREAGKLPTSRLDFWSLNALNNTDHHK